MAQKPIPKECKVILKNVILTKDVDLTLENLKVEIQKELLRRKSKEYAYVYVCITSEKKRTRNVFLEIRDGMVYEFNKERKFSIAGIFSVEIFTQDLKYSEMTFKMDIK